MPALEGDKQVGLELLAPRTAGDDGEKGVHAFTIDAVKRARHWPSPPAASLQRRRTAFSFMRNPTRPIR